LDFDMAVQSYMFDQTAVKAVDALDAVDAVDPVATLPTSLWGATSVNAMISPVAVTKLIVV
jgi:hypothetical protein